MAFKEFTIDIVRHADTGLFLATSDELKGLYVHARSIEELNKRVPVAAKDILEAGGVKVLSVEQVEDDKPRTAFLPVRRKFHLTEQEAA